MTFSPMYIIFCSYSPITLSCLPPHTGLLPPQIVSPPVFIHTHAYNTFLLYKLCIYTYIFCFSIYTPHITDSDICPYQPYFSLNTIIFSSTCFLTKERISVFVAE